jgi:hypothetical protein
VEEQFEKIMEAVCELCHWPYVSQDQEQLTAKCDNCPVERILKEFQV